MLIGFGSSLTWIHLISSPSPTPNTPLISILCFTLGLQALTTVLDLGVHSCKALCHPNWATTHKQTPFFSWSGDHYSLCSLFFSIWSNNKNLNFRIHPISSPPSAPSIPLTSTLHPPLCIRALTTTIDLGVHSCEALVFPVCQPLAGKLSSLPNLYDHYSLCSSVISTWSDN